MTKAIAIFDRLMLALVFSFIFLLTFAWTWRLLALGMIAMLVLSLVG